jgi:hypothetical protein
MLQVIGRFAGLFEKLLYKHANVQGMSCYLSREITEILAYFQLEMMITRIESEKF